jgi:glycosyltransferase involved in cell wall biosynthesis
MKIVIITPYWLKTKGGITTVAFSLFEKLKKIGNQVWVLTPDDGAEAVKLPKSKLSLTLKTINFLRKINPDVVHVHAHGTLLLGAELYKLFLNKNLKIFFTFHTQPHTNFYLTGEKTEERSFLKQFFLNFLLDKCDNVTYVSRSLMKSLQKVGVRSKKSLVINNGVKKRNFSLTKESEFKEKYNLLNTYPVLCMVANFSWDWKVKGIRILIQAFQEILKFYPEAILLIVGDGNYGKYLKDYVGKEGLEKKVIFTGNLENPFIAYSICDIYCHISLNEACPLTPLEAMISGKPIVASNNAGLPEIIKDNFNGLLVNSNYEEVASSILSILKDKKLQEKLSRNAQKIAISKFSWSRITKKYLKMYESKI